MLNTDGYNEDLKQAEREIALIKECVDHLSRNSFNFHRLIVNFTDMYENNIDNMSKRSLIVKPDAKFETVSHQWKHDKPYKCNFYNKDVFSLIGGKAENKYFTRRNYPLECLKCDVFKYCSAASTVSASDRNIPRGVCKVNREILNYLDSKTELYYSGNYFSNQKGKMNKKI